MNPAAREIEDIEVRLLLEAIYSRYGFDLRGYAPASLRRRVLVTMAKMGIRHLGELQHKLLTDTDFFREVLNNLTIHVSEMFRDPAFYLAFRSRVVPLLRTYPFLNIWHAGCATGEEVYASSIVFAEEGLSNRVQIYATDVSTPTLDQAKQGMYSADRLSTFSENYDRAGGSASFSDYYTAAYEQFAMKASLRRNVLFFQHNLVSDQAFGEMHVIFCRNVFIYFGAELRERVLRTFIQSLAPGGFLCLGSSERLSRTGAGAEFVEFANERIYRLQR